MRSVLVPLACVLATSVWPQGSGKPIPRFEEYAVAEVWHREPAVLKPATHSERMFRTQLTNAAKKAPNFAGHYRFTFWGCGSNCAAGALIDLQTGEVFPPPMADPDGKGWERWMISGGMMEDSGIEFRLSSRMVVVRGGVNYSERLHRNIPDVPTSFGKEDAFGKFSKSWVGMLDGETMASAPRPPRR